MAPSETISAFHARTARDESKAKWVSVTGEVCRHAFWVAPIVSLSENKHVFAHHTHSTFQSRGLPRVGDSCTLDPPEGDRRGEQHVMFT
ncbi:hypothetical protein SESBI_08245 [Sesbania bispinosa]|nr:hypothetical protein SESBI_08245 [Sesbania bispinosa]